MNTPPHDCTDWVAHQRTDILADSRNTVHRLKLLLNWHRCLAKLLTIETLLTDRAASVLLRKKFANLRLFRSGKDNGHKGQLLCTLLLHRQWWWCMMSLIVWLRKLPILSKLDEYSWQISTTAVQTLQPDAHVTLVSQFATSCANLWGAGQINHGSSKGQTKVQEPGEWSFSDAFTAREDWRWAIDSGHRCAHLERAMQRWVVKDGSASDDGSELCADSALLVFQWMVVRAPPNGQY